MKTTQKIYYTIAVSVVLVALLAYLPALRNQCVYWGDGVPSEKYFVQFKHLTIDWHRERESS